MLRVTEKPKPIVLCILDGWGVSQDSPGNAITRANPSNFNDLWFSYPHALLVATGQAVGLPEGHVGNSEVGHINLGAGRVVFQDLLRVNNAIADGTFFENGAFTAAVDHITKNNSNIHLMGLVGLGAVHTEMSHLYALLTLLQKKQIPASRIKLHLFTDGRDSPPTSAKIYMSDLENKIKSANLGQIASVSGRYFAMDRDNRWDRTAKAYWAILGKSGNKATSVIPIIDGSYANGKTDEFIEPTVIADETGIPVGPVSANDAVIFFNYRPDRARQLTEAFVLDNLLNLKTYSGEKTSGFERGPKLSNLFFVTLTRYAKDISVSAVAFNPEEVTMPIARVFSERNSMQLHIAETEKYAHVTYFFNGGFEKPFKGEDRILINSPKVASYDKAPEMSANAITQQLIEKINLQIYDFIVVNYANADMVSHSGNIEATIKGVQTIDNNLGILTRAVLAAGGGLIVTADHGNAEEMINLRTGEVDTEHNISPVPAILIFKELEHKAQQLPQGLLADIAPTILGVLQIPKPSQMTGRSLL
jgi:2,3-bisphosphoglycerate-independent phosphoglycerate mutase